MMEKAPHTLTVIPETPAPEEWNAMLISPKAACCTPYAHARYMTTSDIMGLVMRMSTEEKCLVIARILDVDDLDDSDYAGRRLRELVRLRDKV